MPVQSPDRLHPAFTDQPAELAEGSFTGSIAEVASAPVQPVEAVLKEAADAVLDRLNVSDIRYWEDGPQAPNLQAQRVDFAVRVGTLAQQYDYDPLAKRDQLPSVTAKMLTDYYELNDSINRLKAAQNGTFDAEDERARLALIKAAAREFGGLDRDHNVTYADLQRISKISGLPFDARDGGEQGRPLIRDESYLYHDQKSALEGRHASTKEVALPEAPTKSGVAGGIVLKEVLSAHNSGKHHLREQPGRHRAAPQHPHQQ